MPETPAYAPMAAVKAFHDAFEIPRAIEQDAYGQAKTTELRLALIREEFKEVADELLDAMSGTGNLPHLAKELADLLYVVYGTAEVFEIPLQAVFNEVHLSNMSKLGENGEVLRRADGKILKGPRYFEPDIERILPAAV